MPRVRLDAEAVVSSAAKLADANGLESVTLARVANQLGIRAPSLYAHVDGLEDLRRRIGARGARELAQVVSSAAAGRAGRDALTAVASAYRQYAHEHPGTYAAVQRAPSAEHHRDAQAVVDVVLAVLHGYGLHGDDAIHAARAIRSALHGFVLLECGEGFGMPLSIDESFARLVMILDAGLGE